MFDYDTTPVELMTSLATVLWGIAVIVPGDYLATTRIYAPMASVAPDIFWGGVAIALGGAWLTSALLGSVILPRGQLWRRSSACCTAVFWMSATVMGLLTVGPVTIVAFMFVNGLAAGWCWSRLGLL